MEIDPFSRIPEARYQRDNAFRQMVDHMEAQMHAANYTPTEMREAALLAAIHFEYRRIRRFAGYTLDENQTLKAWDLFQELHAYIEKEGSPAKPDQF